MKKILIYKSFNKLNQQFSYYIFRGEILKNIFILFYLLVSTLLLGENITISYPKNKMSYHFYKDLTTNKYSGNYAYLFDEINKDNRYEFKYELENDVYNEDIQIRKIGSFSTNYYYLETPYTQKVFIIGNDDVNIDDIKNKEHLQIGCLGLGIEDLKRVQTIYNLKAYETVTFFRNEMDAMYALKNSKVDVLFILNFKKNNKFDGQILGVANLREYIGIRKDQSELLDRIKPQLDLLFENNDKLLKLNVKNRENYLKYLYADLNNYEEIRKEYKKLKVLVPNRNYIPYYKEKRFKKIGIVPFIMKNIENFLGIPVEYVFSEDEDWDINAVDFSNNDKTMSKEYYRARIAGINHIYDNKITNYDQLDDLRIIKLKGINLDTLLRKVKTKEIIEVDSLKEAFKLLKDREGDILIGPYFLLNSYMNTYNYNKYFKLSPSKFEVVVEMTFKDERLKNILNDLLQSYSVDEIEYVSNSTMLLDKPMNIWLIITDILVVVFIIFSITFIRKHMIKRKLNEFLKLFIKIEDINLMKDERSLYHIQNVAKISKLIAQELKFSKRRIITIEKLGLLHDIGLIFIPSKIILNKKIGTLSKREEEIFREHIQLGELLLKGIGIRARKRRIIEYHHENLDGSGYLGISREHLPIEARILRIADMYDRIVGWQNNSHEKAMEFLEKYKNIYFDERLVDIVSGLEKELKAIYTYENQNKDNDRLLKEFGDILTK